MVAWFLNLAAGAFAGGGLGGLLCPLFLLPAFCILLRDAPHSDRQRLLSLTGLVIGGFLFAIAVLVEGSLAASAWRSACRGYDEGALRNVRDLAIMAVLASCVLFPALWWRSRSWRSAVRTTAVVTSVLPALCLFQMVWAS